jgi:hypothetical protein
MWPSLPAATVCSNLRQARRSSRSRCLERSGESKPSSEYHLLSPDKAGALPDVDVLGIHYIKVRPDRREAFERFVSETLHPAVGNLRPDLRLLYYKVRRGDLRSREWTDFVLVPAK